MEPNSNRRSSSSGRSRSRKRIVIGARDSTRDRYSSLEKSIVGARKPASGTGRRPVPGTLTSAGRRVAGSKAEERQSRIRSNRRRTQLRAALVVTLVVALVVATVWFYRSDAFSVRNVDVVGTKRLSPEKVRGLAAIPADTTLLRLPRSGIEGRLLRYPWIASAHVTRDFPDTVRIRIAERTPAASVAVNSKLRWLIDPTGVWLAKQSVSATSSQAATATAALKTIRDIEGLDPIAGKRTQSETLLNALQVLSQLDPSLAPRIGAISAPSIDKTALVTTDDVEVFVGTADDIQRKQQVAARILKEQAGKVVYINVRTVDRPTWRGLEE